MWGSPLCRHPSQAVQGAPELLEDWLKEGGAEGQIIGGTWQRPGQSVAWPGVIVSFFSLSLQPFSYPVCTPEGVVFDLL